MDFLKRRLPYWPPFILPVSIFSCYENVMIWLEMCRSGHGHWITKLIPSWGRATAMNIGYWCGSHSFRYCGSNLAFFSFFMTPTMGYENLLCFIFFCPIISDYVRYLSYYVIPYKYKIGRFINLWAQWISQDVQELHFFLICKKNNY